MIVFLIDHPSLPKRDFLSETSQLICSGMWEMVGFVIYVRSCDNATSKSSNLTDIIKRSDVEQKGVGSNSSSVADSVSDTGGLSFNGLQLASGIVTLLFSRERWVWHCSVPQETGGPTAPWVRSHTTLHLVLMCVTPVPLISDQQ